MATPQLNLTISAGTSFSQSLSISNADRSVTDLTLLSFTARLAKHPRAFDALASTSSAPVFKYMQMSSSVLDPNAGEVILSLTAAETAQLKEGKYVYSVVMDDGAGILTEILHGLIFVRAAIGQSTILGV
ncbi:tail fibe attachment [Synechococcus phage S-CREM2]|nr:tail fibe attachment [Synechococcus phage S-CREM2]